MRRWLFLVLAVGWLLTGLVGGLAVSLVLYAGDTGCEHETGDSDFGDASWSWWPLGIQCTWTEPPNLVSDHEDPSRGATAFTALYLAAGMALASEERRWRGRQGPGSRTTESGAQLSEVPVGGQSLPLGSPTTGRCAYCSSTLIDGSCPSCDRPPRVTWSTTAAGVIALAGVAFLVLTLLILVLLAAMTGGG